MSQVNEETRRGRGRRNREDVDKFSNSSGISTTITALLTFHKNKGHIKETEMKKIVPEFNRRLRSEIASKLIDVFGLNLKSDDAGKTLYLYSEVSTPPRYKMLGIFQGDLTLADYLRSETHAEDDDESQDTLALVEDSFLLVVLIVTLMNSTPPSEAHPKGSGLRLTALENILRDAGLEPPVHLGPVKKYIDNCASAQFMSRGWLTYRDEEVDGSKHTIIFWGPLAEATLRPMHVLKLYCKMVGAEPHEFVDINNYAKKQESLLGPRPSMLFVNEDDRRANTEVQSATQSVAGQSDEDEEAMTGTRTQGRLSLNFEEMQEGSD